MIHVQCSNLSFEKTYTTIQNISQTWIGKEDNLVIKVWTVHRTLEIVWIGDQFALCFLKGWRKLECTEYLEWPLRSRGSRKPLTKVKHLFFTKFTYTKQNTAVWGSLHLCSWPSSCFYFQIQYNVMRISR